MPMADGVPFSLCQHRSENRERQKRTLEIVVEETQVDERGCNQHFSSKAGREADSQDWLMTETRRFTERVMATASSLYEHKLMQHWLYGKSTDKRESRGGEEMPK